MAEQEKECTGPQLMTVSYTRTWNLDHYESVKIGATVQVNGDAEAAWALAKAEVAEQSRPVIEWRDRRRALAAEQVLNGLPHDLREPVLAMVQSTMNRVEGKGDDHAS